MKLPTKSYLILYHYRKIKCLMGIALKLKIAANEYATITSTNRHQTITFQTYSYTELIQIRDENRNQQVVSGVARLLQAILLHYQRAAAFVSNIHTIKSSIPLVSCNVVQSI